VNFNELYFNSGSLTRRHFSSDLEDSLDEGRLFLRFIQKAKKPCDYERQLLRDHAGRLDAIMDGALVPPYELEIQPSGACNLRCKHCFGRFYPHLPDKIGLTEMKSLVQNVCSFQENGFRVETAKFCGTTGEPLLNTATLYGIERFKAEGRKVILYTNGVLLNGALPDSRPYRDFILQADKLNLSLDAGSAETFKKIKGADCFNNVLRGLKNLAQRKKEINSGLNIITSYVIGNENCHEISRAAKIARETGANEIWFRVDFTNLRQIKEIAPAIKESLDEAKTFEDGNFRVVSVYSENEFNSNGAAFSAQKSGCFNHYFWACIEPNGHLYPCGHRTHAGVESFGNVLEHPLRDLWANRERIQKVSYLPDKQCTVCSPSSGRRNEFVDFLFKIGFDRTWELCERHQDILNS
jgi:radical SAM protein with 4Fe4S-binding SPASM domain